MEEVLCRCRRPRLLGEQLSARRRRLVSVGEAQGIRSGVRARAARSGVRGSGRGRLTSFEGSERGCKFAALVEEGRTEGRSPTSSQGGAPWASLVASLAQDGRRLQGYQSKEEGQLYLPELVHNVVQRTRLCPDLLSSKSVVGPRPGRVNGTASDAAEVVARF